MNPVSDRDLVSVQEARDLVRSAASAAKAWSQASQRDTDRVCAAMAEAAGSRAEELARLAREETGMGRVRDKTLKNRFASEDVWRAYAPLRTRGVVRQYAEARVRELAVPMGVVAALTPSTNPTSTAIYKAIISLKAGNAVVFAPHPRATRCVLATVEILSEAAARAGAPPGLVSAMGTVTLEGTHELMRHPLTNVILATGGSGLVRAAYSAGKPAFGVGPGNVPAVIERSARLDKAVADIVTGKAFDNGLLCSAENSIVCDAPVETRVLTLLGESHAYVCDERETSELAALLAPGGRLNTELAGQDASVIADRAGIRVPADTRVLVVRLSRVGRQEEPLSIEKLSPVLGFYVEDGWRACCERAIQILELGGLGHSLAIHSMDPEVIEAFFHEKPAFRILVNTVAAMGATGYTTGLAPAMTLGPGAWGGSITSDNVTPLHLVNIKRLAYEIRSMTRDAAPPAPGFDPGPSEDLPGPGPDHAAMHEGPDLPGGRSVASPVRPVRAGRAPAFGPADVERIVSEFLSRRASEGR